MLITIDNVEISFLIQYSKGKKISYTFTPEGLLTLKVPLKTPTIAIEQFLNNEKKSILPLIERYNSRIFISSNKTHTQNEIYLLFGKPYTCQQLLDEISNDAPNVSQALKSLYIKSTTKYIKKRLPHFEKLIGVKSKSLSIVDNPKAWGTCSFLKDLTFNYKLSMAPPAVIDSIIIHELCHIHHLNHDRSFWRTVGKYDSNYKKHMDYLSKFGGIMTI